MRGGGIMEKNSHQKGSADLFIIIGIIVFGLIIIGGGWYLYMKSSKPKPITAVIAPQPTANAAGVLRIGQTIDENGLTADQKEFQPFIDYLVSKLAGQGITKGEFVGATSVSEMAQMVRDGQIDMVIDSAFPVYVVDKLAGGQVLADRYKGGPGTYHTAIFVKQNSSIKTLDDLKGKMLAFDSKTSTVGYFLPKAELIKQGYTLVQKTSPTDNCPLTDICYVFVHKSVYETVAHGDTPAGAESELEVDAYFGNQISNYRIISRTPDILRYVVATSAIMKPSLRDAIGNILFSMNTTPQGRIILDSFAQTAKFTPVTDTDAAYGVISDLSSIVEDEIVRQ